jgi:uncharacterized membrane-anchored protein YitT (DUF2179 family)
MRKLILPAVVLLGVLLLAAATVYFLMPADSLPSFFPGHVSHEADQTHFKHGIAALVVAFGLFAFAWFRTGPKNAQTT